MHRPEKELSGELAAARQKVNVGSLYYHYKNPEQAYKVVSVAITEWDDKICVIYQAQYGEKLTFVRPLESWLEEVEWGGKMVSRFTLKT